SSRWPPWRGCTTKSALVSRSTMRPLALMENDVRSGEAPPRSVQLSSLDRGGRDAEGEDIKAHQEAESWRTVWTPTHRAYRVGRFNRSSTAKISPTA
ncbi:hypothetical protein ACJX0J_025279, partial [Zea mays]